MWKSKNGNANRSNVRGEMMSTGATKGCGAYRHFLKGPTRQCRDGEKFDGLNEVHSALNLLADEVTASYFDRARNSIKAVMRAMEFEIPDIIGGDKGLSPCLNQSAKRAVIQSHFDQDVVPESVVFWNSTDGSDPPGWYFYMPDCHCKISGKEYYGIAVRLRDGIGMSWKGGDLRHGSTFPDQYTCKGDLLGTWFGMLMK